MAFKQLIKQADLDYNVPWEEARPRLEGDKAFEAITLESERARIYKVSYPSFLRKCSRITRDVVVTFSMC